MGTDTRPVFSVSVYNFLFIQVLLPTYYYCEFQEKIKEYGQDLFIVSESTNGIGAKERDAISNMAQLSSEGIETLMREKQLDAIVTPDSTVSTILAIGGYPGISVPAGYDETGVPFGICFGGLKGFEPKLIEIAYAFEQATKVRKPPHFKSLI